MQKAGMDLGPGSELLKERKRPLPQESGSSTDDEVDEEEDSDAGDEVRLHNLGGQETLFKGSRIIIHSLYKENEVHYCLLPCITPKLPPVERLAPSGSPGLPLCKPAVPSLSENVSKVKVAESVSSKVEEGIKRQRLEEERKLMLEAAREESRRIKKEHGFNGERSTIHHKGRNNMFFIR